MERDAQIAAAGPYPHGTEAMAPHLFASGGEMGAQILAHDWSRSPLGPIAAWSPALLGVTSMLLGAWFEIVLFWGPDYCAIYNDAYAPTIGDKHPHALGRPAREQWGELWDDLRPLLDRVRLKGESIGAKDRPFYIERSGFGEEVYFDISYSPVRDIDGSVGGVLCLVSETTERVRAARRATAERERLAQMFEQAPGFMALLREPGHIYEFANAAYRELVGPRPLLGRRVVDALPELVDQGFIDQLDQVARDRRTVTGHNLPVLLDRTRDGRERRVVDIVFQPIVEADGSVSGIFIEGIDATPRAAAVEALERSENAFGLAVDVAEIGTWDLELASNTLIWNDRTRAMFGMPPDAPCSLDDFYAGLHPDDAAATTAAFRSALDPAVRATYDVEYRTIGRDDGVVRWVAAKGRGLFGEDGTCVRALGIALDITQRKRAQEALRESEQRFRSLADSAPALIWMCDEAGALIFANRWHEETFGRPVETLMGDGWRSVLHADDAPAFCADFDAAFAARGPFARDVRVIDRTGAVRWLHCEARARLIEGRFAGYVGCDVDVTDAHLAAEALERRIAERTGELAATNRQLSAQIEERERVEATLRQMQRLEAVGQLTAGVAHDFNNLLTVVLGNLEMVGIAARKAGMDERTHQRLDYMRSAAERGATLTAQLLAFSRRQRLEARPIDLNSSVGNMRDLLQSSLGGSIRIETRLQPDLWPALVDPTQIELIILNLAINARDAMEVGGTLVVETANVTLGAPARAEEPAPGDYILIAVADSGSGMTDEVRQKAFEPFFTTKPVGKGSGLGLAQVYGFAKQSGGGVAIDTRVGEGTTVRVYLPRAVERRREPRLPVEVLADDAERHAAGRRVLVVDDDPPVREVTAAMVRAMGAEVIEAGSGGAALQRLEEVDGGFDLMIVDFAMPGMNGAELTAASHQRWPELPSLFVTGYADLSAVAAVPEERIVQKPFRGDELQRKIGRLLAVRAGD